MAEKYDVVIVGAGHNGLTVGSYLAKAGVNVCILEDRDFFGGGVITRELTLPGFKHDACSVWHVFIQANPLIRNDELELFSKFGLKYVYPENLTSVVFDDGMYYTQHQDLDKTCETIATFSEHDAEVYRKFHDWSAKMLDMVLMSMFNPSPSFGESTMMLDSTPEGRILLRALMNSSWDIADEWFETEKMKIVFSRYASELMVSPFTKGTGYHLFVFIPMQHKFNASIPVGGSGGLSEALARCFEHHGGTIRLSSTVKEFKISGGEVSGVILESGEEIEATRGVVSCINVMQMFPDMVPGAELPEDFEWGIKNLKPSGFMAFGQHYALNEPPKWTVGEDSPWIEYCHSDQYEYYRSFQDLDLGVPRDDIINVFVATKIDPTRAPEGKHTMYLYSYAPYFLKDGGPQKWDDIKEDLADRILDRVREIAPNLTDDNILGRRVLSPLDYERRNRSMIRGDINHFGPHNVQMQGCRPLSGWHKYKTPVEKLYIAGASTHPGPGVSGAGRAGVQVVMEDLGIDFEDVID
jgi:phytoene dehydrogenase-like protein